MLARYKMERRRALADMPAALRAATRMDTRKHTRHCLRPEADAVRAYLAAPGDPAWQVFERAYIVAVSARYADDRAPFDALAAQAVAGDVFLGCSCPTRANPDVGRCHTVLALRFMKERYPELDVRFPA